MSVGKQAYVPSQFTLTLMENYGTRSSDFRKAKLRPTQHHRSEAKMPGFARKNKHAFDKENLLEQIRMQKKKSSLMGGSNCDLKQALMKTRIKVGKDSEEGSSNMGQSLKREIELLVDMIDKQSQEIKRIKTSKKYNRFVELQTTREVYQEEMVDVARKMKSFHFAMREQRRVFRDHKRREKGMKDMSRAVKQQITIEKNAILNQIDELNGQIKEGYQKQFNLKRDKERIIKEILELQRKTGKLYLIQHSKVEQSPQKPVKNEQMEQLLNKFANKQEQDKPQSGLNADNYDQEQYGTESLSEEDYEMNENWEKDVRENEYRQRRANISF